MALIAVQGDKVQAAGFTPSTPGVTSTQTTVYINGSAVIQEGDVVATHTKGLASHSGATMKASQSFVKINGTKVIVNGDAASLDSSHTILANTQSFVSIN